MKNYLLPLLLFVFPLLLSQQAVAQTQLELSRASSSTTTTGPTTSPLSATLLENTTGTTFTPALPATSVSISLSNQQYTGTYGNVGTGVVVGAATSTTSASVTSQAVFRAMNSTGSPVGTPFTSSPCGPVGTGIDVNANYGFNVLLSTKPLAGSATTARYRYVDITLTFSRPVDKPVIQVVGLGGVFSNGTANQSFASELELILPATGVTLSKLSGSAELDVTANKILNNSATPGEICGNGAACGSVLATGSGITSLTFRVYLRGVGLTGSAWDATTAHPGDAFIIGVSLDKAPTPTATAQFAMTPPITLYNVCPATTANLTLVQPTGTTFEWHTVATNPSAGTKVNNPASVSAPGPYYLYSLNGPACYSPASTSPVTVGTQVCTACGLLYNTDFETNQVAAVNYNAVDEILVPNWGTTAPDLRIEVWRSGFNGVPSYSGNQFIELNANSPSTIYQNFTGLAGGSYTLNFAHRGRSGVDVMNVSIGSPVASTVTSGTVVTGTIYNDLGNFSDGNTAWGFYSITFTLPTGVGTGFSLRFNSISATGGNTTFGNFLDAIAVSDVAPALSLSDLAIVCPATTADISSLTATNPPASTTQTYHSGPVATTANKLASTVVGPGTYHTAFYDGTKACYGATTDIIVSLTTPAAPTLTTVQPTCTVSTGSITVTAPTGAGLTYSINGTTYTGSASFTGVAPGAYSVRARNGSTACTSPATNVTINAQPATPVATLTNATVCAGTTASLTATGGASYRFSTGLSVTAATGVLTVSPGTTTPYSVTVTSAQGCTAVANAAVTVNAAVTATITGSGATICQGQSTTLTATGGISYRWSTSAITPSVMATTGGVYSVTVTGSQGCTGVAAASITVNPAPALTINSATVCAGTSTTLTANGCDGGTLIWSTGDNTASLVVTPLLTTAYSATCTLSTSCTATMLVTVTVNASPSYIVAPVVVSATCSETGTNSNAYIDLTTLQNTERAGSSVGSGYTGPAYSAPTSKVVSGGSVSFTGLANPGNRQAYTIRLYRAGGTCFTDVSALLIPTDCGCPTPNCVLTTVQKLRR